MKTPRQTAKLLLQQYRTQTISLLLTFMLGILVHLYVMTNKFFNFFEMNNILAPMSYAQGDTLQLGRWFLPVASNLFTSFSIPAVNGVLLIGYLSIASLLVCEILHIKAMGYRVLMGMAVVTFPGVASSFAYGVNADAIGFSVCIAVLAVYLTAKWKYGIFPGIVLVACSIGVYQPFFAVSIAMVYCLLFMEAAYKNFEVRQFFRTVLKYLILLAAGFVLYYVILQGTLVITGTNLSDYHGVDSMTSFTPKGIAKGLVYTYGYFLSYFFTTSYVQNTVAVLANIVLAVLLLTKSIGAIKRHMQGKRNQIFWFLAILCFLPLGLNAAPFLMADRVGNGVDIYMMYSMMFVFALLLQLMEDTETETKPIVQWAAVLGMTVVIGNGYLVSNQIYHRMEAMTVTTTTLLNRVAGRMESHPDWNPDMPVYFTNARRLVNDNYEVEIPWYDEMENIAGTEIKPFYNERAIRNYMKVYLHFPVALATEEEKAVTDEQINISEMPLFPAPDSIQVVDGVMVVKLNEKE